MQRTYVIVTANLVHGDGHVANSRGIQRLKRGVSLPDFVATFLGLRSIRSYDLYDRGHGTYTTDALPVEITRTAGTGNARLTFTFTVFPEDDLSYHLNALTNAEIERDKKEFLR